MAGRVVFVRFVKQKRLSRRRLKVVMSSSTDLFQVAQYFDHHRAGDDIATALRTRLRWRTERISQFARRFRFRIYFGADRFDPDLADCAIPTGISPLSLTTQQGHQVPHLFRLWLY